MTHAFPTRRSSDLHLGVVSLRENDLPGAIALFRRAVAMDPTYAEAGFNLGVGLRGQDDLAGAAAAIDAALEHDPDNRSEEHTSELQSLMRISYAVFCLKKKKTTHANRTHY